MVKSCEPAPILASGGRFNSGEVNIDNASVNVDPSGATAVTRCTAAGLVDVLYQTDNGVTVVTGWVDTNGALQPAASVPAKLPDGDCETAPTGTVDIHAECGCDDVAGDQSNIVGYVTATRVAVADDGTIATTVLGTFTDGTLATVYTPVNPVDCDSIGTDVRETYTDVQPICATLPDGTNVALLQVAIRDKYTHARISTIYEYPDTGGTVPAADITLTDFKDCC